jgi:hypothetical protein
MQYDRDELLVFVRWGRLPRPPQGPPRRRWRRERPKPEPQRLRPEPAVPSPAQPLSPHEYLELEFSVGEESRR